MPGGYFHQRNQSQDVGTLSQNKALKNKIQHRKRAALNPGVDGSDAGEYVIDNMH